MPVFADDVNNPQIKNVGDFFNYLGKYVQTPEGQNSLQEMSCLFGDTMVQYRCRQNLEHQKQVNLIQQLTSSCNTGNNSSCIYLQNLLNQQTLNTMQKQIEEQNQNKMINCSPNGNGGFHCTEF